MSSAALPPSSVSCAVCLCMYMCVVLCCVVSSAALPPISGSCVVCLSLRCGSLAFRALAQSHDLLVVLRKIQIQNTLVTDKMKVAHRVALAPGKSPDATRARSHVLRTASDCSGLLRNKRSRVPRVQIQIQIQNIYTCGTGQTRNKLLEQWVPETSRAADSGIDRHQRTNGMFACSRQPCAAAPLRPLLARGTPGQCGSRRRAETGVPCLCLVGVAPWREVACASDGRQLRAGPVETPCAS